MEQHRREPVELDSEVSNDAAKELEAWLVESAAEGVPELVLVALLRAYAATSEERGYVPRTWMIDDDTE